MEFKLGEFRELMSNGGIRPLISSVIPYALLALSSGTLSAAVAKLNNAHAPSIAGVLASGNYFTSSDILVVPKFSPSSYLLFGAFLISLGFSFLLSGIVGSQVDLILYGEHDGFFKEASNGFAKLAVFGLASLIVYTLVSIGLAYAPVPIAVFARGILKVFLLVPPVLSLIDEGSFENLTMFLSTYAKEIAAFALLVAIISSIGAVLPAISVATNIISTLVLALLPSYYITLCYA